MFARHSSLLFVLCCPIACGDSGASDESTPTDDSTGSSGDSSSETSQGPTSSESSGDSSGSSSSDTGVPGDGPFYYADVKPILDGRCIACHSEGGVAPFSLTTYDDAATYGAAIVGATQARVMPPWPAEAGCNTYAHDPSLTDEQLETLQAWVDADAPEGDPADQGEPLPGVAPELPRVDFNLTMAEAHTPHAGEGHDEHRCFLIDWPSSDDTFVTGFEVIPGNDAVVHHVVARIVAGEDLDDVEAADAADPAYGWDCGAGTGMTGREGALLGLWVPGRGAAVYPSDTGLAVTPGSRLLLNMHYNTHSGGSGPDQTGIDFMVEDSVARPGQAISIVDPTWLFGNNMLIPAGDASVTHSVDYALDDFAGPVEIYEMTMHMHALGANTRLWVNRAGGSETCLVNIPNWDFDWQIGYALQQSVRIEAGETLGLSCTFDNSAANQPIIDGEQRDPIDVAWGEDTYDEMCTAFVFVAPAP